jgi:very-short-patch-repair endonuclease
LKHPPEVERARRLRQTQSAAEKLLWERLRRNQLNGWGFRRQSPVGKFVVDFLCHKPKLIVEVDGPTHDDAEQRAFDAARTVELERDGFLVIRAKERVVRDAPERVLDWITRVGELVLAQKFVSGELRRMDTVPLP